MKKHLLFLSITALLLSACSTDLDVKGDWKETMVVYGLLDQSQSKQYIKINKAFLGEGNAFSFAQVKDSTQFVNALSVKLIQLPNGPQYTLSPDGSIPKDPGTFYAPDQANAIYSFTTPKIPNISTPDPTDSINNLSTSATYKLSIRNSETGSEVSATTKLVSDFNFSLPTSGITLFNIINKNNNAYKFRVTWNSTANAKLYQLIMRFNYVDSTLTGKVNQHIDKIFSEVKTQGVGGGELIEFTIVGQEYLQYIANQISDYPGLIKRTPGNVDLIGIAAGEELSTFIDVNKPSTGVVQQKPEYTNIANGLGVFSARYYKAPFSRSMDKATRDTLAGGFRTCHLKFTDNNGIWPGCQ